MRVDFNKVWAQIFAKRKRFAEERRVGLVSYDGKNDAVVFHFDDRTSRYRYWIPFAELKTHEGQMKWLYQIRGKGWFTINYLNDLLDVLEYSGLRPRT